MRKFLLPLSFFFCLQLSAQSLEIGINITPTLSYRIPAYRDASEHAISIQAGEKPMHTFDFGVDIRSSLGERLKIGTALLYSQKGFSNIHAGSILDDYRISRAYIVDFVQDYLEIPFFLTYTVLNREKVSLYPLMGFTNSMLLRSRNEVAVRSGEINHELQQQLSKPYLRHEALHHLGLLFGWGIMVRADQRTFLGVETLGKLMLTPLHDYVSSSHRQLYSAGLNFRFVRSIH